MKIQLTVRPTMEQPQWPSLLNKSPITKANLHISCFSLASNRADMRWAEKRWNIFHASNMGQETVGVLSDLWTPSCQKILSYNLHISSSYYFSPLLYYCLRPQLLRSFFLLSLCIPTLLHHSSLRSKRQLDLLKTNNRTSEPPQVVSATSELLRDN